MGQFIFGKMVDSTVFWGGSSNCYPLAFIIGPITQLLTRCQFGVLLDYFPELRICFIVCTLLLSVNVYNKCMTVLVTSLNTEHCNSISYVIDRVM